MALSVASTVVLIRVLSDNRDLHTPAGHIAVGWLVVEDLFTVVVLVLLPALFGAGGDADAAVARRSALTAVKVAALVAFTVVVGTRVIPWLLDHVAATRLARAVHADGAGDRARHRGRVGDGLRRVDGARRVPRRHGRRPVGLQPARRVRGAADARRVRRAVLRLGRHAARPGARCSTPALVAGDAGGRPGRQAARPRWCSCWLLRYPCASRSPSRWRWRRSASSRSSSRRSAATSGMLTTEATNTLVAASIVSIVLNPLLYRASVRSSGGVARGRRSGALLNRDRRRRTRAADADARGADPAHRAVVIGYGPTGRTVSRLLRDNGIEPTVVELNMDTVRELRARRRGRGLRRRDAAGHAGGGRRRRRPAA